MAISHTIQLKVNITKNTVKSWSGDTINLDALRVVHDDTILFAFWFVRDEYIEESQVTAERNLDLSSGLTVARYDCDNQLGGDAGDLANLAYVSTYNQQGDATLEDLTIGRITFEVPFTSAAIATELGTEKKTSVWSEVAIVQDGIPSTLVQFEHPIHQQINDNTEAEAAGEPNYLDEDETHAAFMEIDRDEETGATSVLTIKQGQHDVISDVNSGTHDITLVDPTDYDDSQKREARVTIIQEGTVAPDITVDGGSNIETPYDGAVATFSMGGQWSEVTFRINRAGTAWYTTSRSA